MGEDDVFNNIEPDAQDREDIRLRKEVTFDIEVSSETNKMIALEFFGAMYKKHLLILFIGGAIAVASLFISLVTYGSVYWVGALDERRIALNGGLLAMPLMVILLMALVERVVYSRDPWTLDRLGLQSFTSPSSRMAWFAGLMPLAFLLLGFLNPESMVSPNFVNPLFLLLIIGDVPVAVFEEIVFRGVYWKYLLIRYSKGAQMWRVNVINAFAFMVMHLPVLFVLYSEAILSGSLASQTPVFGLYLISYFLLGLILCYLRDTFKNLLAPIVFHVIYNVIFYSFQFNGVMVILVEALILLAILGSRVLGLFKGTASIQGTNSPLKEAVLGSRLHEWFRVAFLVGNGLVMVYYGSEMARGSILLSIIAAVVVGAALTFMGVLYLKRAWFFKLPHE